MGYELEWFRTFGRNDLVDVQALIVRSIEFDPETRHSIKFDVISCKSREETIIHAFVSMPQCT